MTSYSQHCYYVILISCLSGNSFFLYSTYISRQQISAIHKPIIRKFAHKFGVGSSLISKFLKVSPPLKIWWGKNLNIWLCCMGLVSMFTLLDPV